MAANPTLIQSVNAASSAASPTTITPTFAATQVGSFLLIAVAVAGSSVNITTPANWLQTIIGSVVGVGQIAILQRANNPGGITAVAITVTATGGSAVASGFEFSGMPAAPVNDVAAQAVINGGTLITAPWTPPPFVNELAFTTIAFNALQTLSSMSFGVPGWSANTAPGTTTLGTPNLTLANWWNLTPGPGAEIDTAIISGSVLLMRANARFQTGANGPLYGSGGPEGTLGLSGSPNPQGSWSVG